MFSPNVGVAEKYDYLGEKFTCAYKWLTETDIKPLAAGSYPIMSDTVVANVQEYTTFPAGQGSLETHERYFDIQYMAPGREQFRVCKGDGLAGKERSEVNDLIFYGKPEFSDNVFLEEGDPIVVAPEDTYEPRYQADGSYEVKKVVVEVALQLNSADTGSNACKVVPSNS